MVIHKFDSLIKSFPQPANSAVVCWFFLKCMIYKGNVFSFRADGRSYTQIILIMWKTLFEAALRSGESFALALFNHLGDPERTFC